MVKYYNSVEPDLQEWALKHAVFTAFAPLNGRHANLSPQGSPARSVSILYPNLCGYVDATGSGIETVSHYLDADQAPFFTQSSLDYTLDFDMLFDLLHIPLPELQSNSATTFGLNLSRRKHVLSNILNSSKGNN